MALILRFFDLFLPQSLRKSPRALVRGYTFAGIIFANFLLFPAIYYAELFLLDLEENLRTAIVLTTISLVGHVVPLWVLKRFESYALSCNLYIAIQGVVMIAGIQVTGGYLESPLPQLLLLSPVMAFALLGLRWGVMWLAVILAVCVGLYYSAGYGIGYVQLVQNAEVIQAMAMLFQFILIILFGAILSIYETLQGMLERELQAEKNRLAHWASHDHLTGLVNRFEFFRRLRAHVEDAQNRSQNVGVVYIDLDDFKPVNDTHGHHMGDETLRAIAERLGDTLRLSDTTARLGGDEFGLILPGIRVPEDIESIMPKITEAIGMPIRVDDIEVAVRASCGVAIFPKHTRDYNDLCRQADTAMYRAKSSGEPYLIYAENMDEPPGPETKGAA